MFTVAALYKFAPFPDPAALRDVLGNRTAHFLALARGEDDREGTPVRPDKSISHEITFDRDLVDTRAMRAELLVLSEAVMRRVRKQHLAAKTIHLKVRDARFRTATRSLTLRAPTSQTRGLFQVAAGLLERWLAEHRNTPVRLLGVGVSGFSEAIEPATGAPGLDAAVDAITGRFGDASLVRGLSLERRPRNRR